MTLPMWRLLSCPPCQKQSRLASILFTLLQEIKGLSNEHHQKRAWTKNPGSKLSQFFYYVGAGSKAIAWLACCSWPLPTAARHRLIHCCKSNHHLSIKKGAATGKGHGEALSCPNELARAVLVCSQVLPGTSSIRSLLLEVNWQGTALGLGWVFLISRYQTNSNPLGRVFIWGQCPVPVSLQYEPESSWAC